MIGILIRRWREWREQRNRAHDVREFAMYTALKYGHERDATVGEYVEWRRKKYTYCDNCRCPELFHKNELIRAQCEICDCASFIGPRVNCACTPVITKKSTRKHASKKPSMTKAEHSDAMFDYWKIDKRFEDSVNRFHWGMVTDRQEICEQLLAEIWGYA